MEIPFVKMHGAKNDFILVDDRAETFPLHDRDWIARSAARRTGVGCEGLILIQPSTDADFRMRFLNPDGSEVDMCGNGARCVARFAHELGVALASMRIETGAGLVCAEVADGSVRLTMTEPRDWRMNQTLELKGESPLLGHSVNTGVLHFVTEVPNIDAVDVAQLGALVRCHGAFDPDGTNANFFSVAGENRIRVRTYERGVEAETLACGTGIVATGLVAARLGRVSLPVTVRPTGGDTLQVDGRWENDLPAAVTLTGPAVPVYRGILDYPG